MFFNDNSNNSNNTNIDGEFKKESFFDKFKLPIFIGGGVLLLGIIVLVIFLTRENYELVLSGDSEIVVGLNSEYVDPGYVATDEDNNDVSSKVKIVNEVDTSKEGDYEVKYSIGGTSKTRIVHVKEIVSETYLVLLGDDFMSLSIGDVFEDFGYTAIDTVDGDVTNDVEVTNNVDTSKEGTYEVIYSVTNSDGVTTTKKRTVVVK